MTRWPIVVAVVLLPLAFLAGRQSAPARVVTRDVVRTETATVERVRTVEVRAQAEAKDVAEKVRTVTVTKWRWLPGGVIEADATTRAATDTQASTSRFSSSVEEAKREVDVRQTTVELHTREVVTARPSWSVALLPGAQFAGAKALDIRGPLVIGAVVERRVLGPLWLGLWGSTSGAAGISLRGDL